MVVHIKTHAFKFTALGNGVVCLQTSLSSSIVVLRLELEPLGISLGLSQEFSALVIYQLSSPLTSSLSLPHHTNQTEG